MWSKRWALVLALVWLCRSASDLAAADARVRTNSSFVLDVWTTEQGLPQNEITCMLQSHEGYLWFGTRSGLVRFDGHGFTDYNESNTPGLRSSRIVQLFEDSRHDLWIGTANAGVVRIHDGQIVSTGIGEAASAGSLAAACEDPGGAVWLYLTNGQVWRWQDGTSKAFAAPTEQVTDYRGLIAEPNGPLWVGTDRNLLSINWKAAAQSATLAVEQRVGLGTLDFLLPSRSGGFWRLAQGRIQKWRANAEGPELDFGWYPWLASDRFGVRVYAACEDLRGHLIVGTRGSGVYWFDGQGQATHLCTTNQSLSNDFVFALVMDREGDLWVGTDGGGLNRVKRASFEVAEPTKGWVVQAAAGDERGGVWIAANFKPLSYWDGETLQPISNVRTVYVDRENHVWTGTWGAGLLQVRANKLQSVTGFPSALPHTSVIHQDRRGWIWTGGPEGLASWDGQQWRVLGPRDGLSTNWVQALADDPQGALWIGTEGAGLNRWRDGHCTVYRKEADGIPSDSVSSLYADEQGVIWVGTDGGGLARFENGKWTRFSRREGLASDSIGYITEDPQGYLWIGSNAGLMHVPKQALNAFAQGRTNTVPCRVFGPADGLPTRECSSGTQPGPGRTGDGRLWFPTIKGLAAVDPAIVQPNTNPPPVRIEAVLIDGRVQQDNALGSGPPPALVVRPGKEQIEIQYSSLSLAAPDRARFKYRLEGYQSDWVDAGAERKARYTRLPPSQYRFQVIACNEDGVWNRVGAALALTVSPPFWRTWWFLGSSTVALLGVITAVVHHLSTQKLQRQLGQLRQREALEKERARIARDIHDQLGASLTQVALLGELVEGDKDAPEEVEAHARQISQTARDTTRVLDEIVWAVNPANDTLDGLMTYICKYTQEYLSVAGLHYRLDVPGQLPATPLPPEVRHNVFLACKEAVTNIVRHAQATSVWVRLRLEPTSFTLEIEDNGRGVSGLDQKTQRNGLKNMRNRMEEIGGEFLLRPAPERGTLSRFVVPFGPNGSRNGHSH